MHWGHQRHYYDLLWASVPRFSLIRGQQRLSPNSGGSLNSSKSCLTLILTLVYPNFGGNIPIRMPYVKYEDKSTVSNTRWPGNHIKRALLREFSIPTVWSLASMDASSALLTTGLWPYKSTRGSGRSNASPRGFKLGDSNLSKLTDVFATMQLTGPDVSLRLVMLIPLAIKLCVFDAWNELTRID
jgi:hypothetical protein